MVKVDDMSPDIIETEDDLNPYNRYKHTDAEMASYLSKNILPKSEEERQIRDYKKPDEEPIRDVYKTMFFGWKDSGKTKVLHEMEKLKIGEPEIEKNKLNSHVKFLLHNGFLKEASPLEFADAEGKGDIQFLNFSGRDIRYRDIHYPEGPLVTMGDAEAFVKELILFFKSCNWAALNPEIYAALTATPENPSGLKAPKAMVFENYSILTNEIMNHVRIQTFTPQAREKKIDKIVREGGELGSALNQEFQNWDVRNRNWEYMGGSTQRSVIHYGASARARKKWRKNKPTDEDDLALYGASTYAFNIIVYLYSEDEDDGTKTYWGRIISSDFTPADYVSEPIKDPTYIKIVSEISKFSHAPILRKYGRWMRAKTKAGNEVIYWKENEKEKTKKSEEK